MPPCIHKLVHRCIEQQHVCGVSGVVSSLYLWDCSWSLFRVCDSVLVLVLVSVHVCTCVDVCVCVRASCFVVSFWSTWVSSLSSSPSIVSAHAVAYFGAVPGIGVPVLASEQQRCVCVCVRVYVRVRVCVCVCVVSPKMCGGRTTLLLWRQVWSRIVIPFRQWPWRLLGSELLLPFIKNPSKLETRRYGVRDLTVVTDMYDERTCCLDASVTEPLRAKFTLADWDPATGGTTALELLSLLVELRRRLKLTTMHLERRLKEIKLSIPYSGGRPPAESFCYGSVLNQLWKRHLDLGGQNPLVSTRDSLQREGHEPTTFCFPNCVGERVCGWFGFLKPPGLCMHPGMAATFYNIGWAGYAQARAPTSTFQILQC
jgi:hypothetical protein